MEVPYEIGFDWPGDVGESRFSKSVGGRRRTPDHGCTIRSHGEPAAHVS